jgi:hypothetical protein
MFGGNSFGDAYFGGGAMGATETRAVCATVTLNPVIAANDLELTPVLVATPTLQSVTEATLSLVPPGDC